MFLREHYPNNDQMVLVFHGQTGDVSNPIRLWDQWALDEPLQPEGTIIDARQYHLVVSGSWTRHNSLGESLLLGEGDISSSEQTVATYWFEAMEDNSEMIIIIPINNRIQWAAQKISMIPGDEYTVPTLEKQQSLVVASGTAFPNDRSVGPEYSSYNIPKNSSPLAVNMPEGGYLIHMSDEGEYAFPSQPSQA